MRIFSYIMVTGKMNALKPRTKPTLAIFEPTILPMAIEEASLTAAAKLTTISGSEVPKAIIVKPITSGDKPMRAAKSLPPRTIHSAP